MSISAHDWEACLRVLQHLSENPSLIDNDERAKALIAKIHTKGKRGQRLKARAARQHNDRTLRAATQLQREQALPVATLSQALRSAMPEPYDTLQSGDALPSENNLLPDTTLQRAVPCYICKQPFHNLHFFYHSLCPSCAELNYSKRGQQADLSNRIAVVTGGRVKIGYYVARHLLRSGATVIVTTRFAHDAARRFSSEPDYPQWRERLHIYPLDLRDLPAVEEFVEYLFEKHPYLDILINNAAQTIKRPREFYRHLLENALPAPAVGEPGAAALRIESPPRQRPALLEWDARYPNDTGLELYFPTAHHDRDGQQIDLRSENSWRLRLDEVTPLEMLEVQLVNAVSPFMLNGKLKPLLLRSPFERRFIINVSAMEGQFNRGYKSEFHPHTNMAKAALNMMTRTSASDYATSGIYMNSVDTGWITDENPYPIKTGIHERTGFVPPLDAVDGMARILAPILQGVSKPIEPLHGHFLKNYIPHPW